MKKSPIELLSLIIWQLSMSQTVKFPEGGPSNHRTLHGGLECQLQVMEKLLLRPCAGLGRVGRVGGQERWVAREKHII